MTDIILYHCNLCNYRTKWKCNLTKHKKFKHDIGVIWFYCDQNDCNYKCKENGSLTRHKANIHDIGVIWYHCDQNDCNYKCKDNCHLTSHKKFKHDIGVIWFYCDQENCEYRCKDSSSLTTHKKFKHNIGVIWYSCDIENCKYKCKSNVDLKKHKEFVHDIGEYKCDYCLQNRNSHIYHKKHYICRNCFNKATGKTSKIEKIWSDYLDKHIGTEYLLSSDKNLRYSGGCQLYRPDKLYVGIDMVELDECDENQHRYNNGDYSCDEKRISDIYDEDGICGKKMVVIRWNPHNYKVPERYTRKNQKERLDMMVKLKKYLRKNPPEDKIYIYYMFYDQDSDKLSQK